MTRDKASAPSTGPGCIPAGPDASAHAVMLDYIDGLANAHALEDVWHLYCATMARFGFDRLIYGLTRVAGADGSLGALDDALVLSNHDPGYFDRFVRGQMFLDAPGMAWARGNTGAIGWGELWRDPDQLAPATRRVIAFNRSRGVVAGYTISIAHSSQRTFAMVSMTGRPGLSQADLDATWAREGRHIWAMTQVFHLKVASLPQPAPACELSGRQREALEWVGDGKSSPEIATIMGVSVPTVEKHLRLAREKLRVSTTAQAVLKAALQNQIYVIASDSLALPDLGGRTSPDRSGNLTET